jgi:hypothetical protein
MSQVLGAFGLLDFTILWLHPAWRAFWNLSSVYHLNSFISGSGEQRILNQWMRWHYCTYVMIIIIKNIVATI